MMERKLYKIKLQDAPFETGQVERMKKKFVKQLEIGKDEIGYFVFTDSITNKAYSTVNDNIQIAFKNNELKDIGDASDMFSLPVLSKIVKKYFLCYPKENGT
jgi:hypothetical protein